MSSAESSYQQSFLQRVSTPFFLVLSLLLVFAGTSVSVFAAMIVCVIAGVENSDLQARLGLAATLIGFVGSIYLLIRARRSPPSQKQQARTTASAPPPLPIGQAVQHDIRRSDEPAEVGGHKATAGLVREDIEDDIDQIPVESNRIVDWLKVCTTPVLIAFNASIVFVGLAGTLSPTFGTIGLVVVPIAFGLALTSHLMGTHFNVPGDRLSYPYFAWRLGLPLSGINDANAQTINKRGVDVLASLGEKNPKYKTVHHYHVNLSGDFGARRLMFRSKFKRDQFLSILRTIRPDVRITRWS
ncbi:hypothetical protein CT676_27505 [Bradyrhizobium sp. MOS001]|uniref:hypothetical protein n=1 Tax=Bradyrhizobium sp. MOS001 TaxID=2133948 RepID=UPI0010755E50|nr:hypothetical protein [Bradyrhizobium sp. MOS001]TFW57945.1 hypothetical protein CT676_27505 [Bradyrhizobium sp. MOS001]